MSIPQAAEQQIVYADFLALLTQQYEDIRWGPAYAAGTRVLVKIRNNRWKPYLITDLAAPLTPNPLGVNVNDGSGNAIPSSTAYNAGTTRGLNVRIVGQPSANLGLVQVANASGGRLSTLDSSGATSVYAQLGIGNTATAFVAVNTGQVFHAKNVDPANDCWIGLDAGVTAGTGWLLKANSVGAQSELHIRNSGTAFTPNAIATVSSTVAYMIT